MKLTCRVGSLSEVECDVVVVNLFQGASRPGGATAAIDRALQGLLSQAIQTEGFQGRLGETSLFDTWGGIRARRAILVGLGKPEEFEPDCVRKATGAALKRAREVTARKVSTVLHGAGVGGLSPSQAAQALAEGALLASYQFTKYKTAHEDKPFAEEVEVVELESEKLPAIRQGLKRGQLLAAAANLARDLANEPPATMTPSRLAEEAQTLARGQDLDCRVRTMKEIERLGMGGLLAVARGSAEPPTFIELVYRPPGRSQKKIAVVGKGVTFDSGGLCLKPAKSMENMKNDKAGAAAVLGIMSSLKALRPSVTVMGLIAATENMPGDRAYKLGDVLKTLGGKTVEITHTDAEGRLTLADALAYAVRRGADEIIELSTLTGACVVALGDLCTGIMGEEALVDRLISAGQRAGERLWPLPLLVDYLEDLKSPVADLKNSSNKPEAGAIVAGLFLREFVEGHAWAHLDIAGPAWLEREHLYHPRGSTGVGVRTVLEYLTGPEMGKSKGKGS